VPSTARTTATEGSAGVEAIFSTSIRPSRKNTQSVNVPPVSIATRKSLHPHIVRSQQ
jgi:hypothetical protein